MAHFALRRFGRRDLSDTSRPWVEYFITLLGENRDDTVLGSLTVAFVTSVWHQECFSFSITCYDVQLNVLLRRYNTLKDQEHRRGGTQQDTVAYIHKLIKSCSLEASFQLQLEQEYSFLEKHIPAEWNLGIKTSHFPCPNVVFILTEHMWVTCASSKWF